MPSTIRETNIVIKMHDIVAAYRQALKTNKMLPTAYVLRGLIEKSLSDQQKQVYRLICQEKRITSKAVTEALCIHTNHADNVLNRMADMGLVQKEAMSDENGLYYEWILKLPPSIKR